MTLVWTDRPGKGLQNRLYLRLVPPGGGAADRRRRHRLPQPAQQRAARARRQPRRPAPGRSRSTASTSPSASRRWPRRCGRTSRSRSPTASGSRPSRSTSARSSITAASMGFYSFMAPARERTKQLVDVLRVNDRTGVVPVRRLGQPGAPRAPRSPAPRPRPRIKAAIDTIVPAGATSIGGGLQQGVADLAAGGDPAHPQAIVLVSDGHENTPPWVGGGLHQLAAGLVRRAGPQRGAPGVPADHEDLHGVARRGERRGAAAGARRGPRRPVPVDPQRRRDRQAARDLRAPAGAGRRRGGHRRRQRRGRRPRHVAADPTRGAGATPDLPELAGLAGPRRRPASAAGGRSLQNIPPVPVDDTLGSVAFVVSWHDPSRPVHLVSLLSPSLQTSRRAWRAATARSRVELPCHPGGRPEPGAWQLRVRADGGRGPSATPGAHTARRPSACG